MSHVSCIFTLKPIIDFLHADASIYVTEINALKERITELEKENAELREIASTPIKIEEVIVKEEKPRSKPRAAPPILVVDDTTFAKEAETYEEPVNTIVENTEKVVVVHEEKSRKEYQQEYQRNYRKLKKEKQININNKE